MKFVLVLKAMMNQKRIAQHSKLVPSYVCLTDLANSVEAILEKSQNILLVDHFTENACKAQNTKNSSYLELACLESLFLEPNPVSFGPYFIRT